jgi:hypothetical protein
MKSKAYSKKRWLSWNLQPRTAGGASQCASEPKSSWNSLNSLPRRVKGKKEKEKHIWKSVG